MADLNMDGWVWYLFIHQCRSLNHSPQSTNLTGSVTLIKFNQNWNYYRDTMDEKGTNLMESSPFSTITENPYEFFSYHYVMYCFTITTQLLVFLFGTLSNMLLCTTVVYFQRLHSPFNGLVFALSVGNFLASVIAMPIAFTLVRHQHMYKSLQTALCPLTSFLFNLFKWHTVLIMAEMAIIRARIVCISRRWRPSKRTFIIIEITNVAATFSFALYRIFSNNNICVKYHADDQNHTLVNLTVFLILYVTLVIGYVILSVITHKRAAASEDADGRNRRFYNNRFEIATLRASFSIVISYLLLHLPYIVYTLTLHFELTNDQSYYTHSFLVSICFLNTVTDTIILLMTSSVYRKHVCLLLGIERPVVHPVVH